MVLGSYFVVLGGYNLYVVKLWGVVAGYSDVSRWFEMLLGGSR